MYLIIGKDGYRAILVLAERNTSYCIIKKFPHGKNAKDVARAVLRLLYANRMTGILTITTNNGSEFSGRRKITKALMEGMVYSADSYCS